MTPETTPAPLTWHKAEGKHTGITGGIGPHWVVERTHARAWHVRRVLSPGNLLRRQGAPSVYLGVERTLRAAKLLAERDAEMDDEGGSPARMAGGGRPVTTTREERGAEAYHEARDAQNAARGAALHDEIAGISSDSIHDLAERAIERLNGLYTYDDEDRMIHEAMSARLADLNRDD